MDQWPKHLRSRTIKLLEGNTEVDLYELKVGNGFLDVTLKEWGTKEK